MKDREFVSLWVALAIIGAVAVLAYRSIDATAETLGWVEQAHRVRQELEEVASVYARAASARRAYVVAGDDAQLAEVPTLDLRLALAVGDVRPLLAGDPSQLRRLELLDQLLRARLDGLQASVERRRREGYAAETADGLTLVARIREVREEMDQAENQLLADRDARTRRDVTRTKIAEVVGTCASFAILLLAFRRLRREIARRRLSEGALRSSEGFLGSIVENLPDMIFVKEATDLRFERINRAGEELLGIERKDLVRKNDFDFFPAPQARAFQARDREALSRGVVVEVPEEPIQTKDGERWVHTKTVPIVDPHGHPAYLLSISEDITDRRKAADALKQAKEAAEAANRELEAFSYSVAHDLRAPLRAIDGFSAALEEDSAARLDEEGRQHLARVRAAARQMGELIDGLLGLSRVSRAEIHREKVDLTRLAKESGNRLREANPGRDVELVIEEGLSAEGDARLLTAVFDNLLSNAWKFTSKRAHARIEVGRTSNRGQASVFVRDNGAGFDPASAERLFGAFQRLHSTAEFEGNGIGLATVQRIVRRHGGRIWAESEADRGATFFFSL